MKKIWCLLLLCCFALPCAAAGITNYPPLNRADFWQNNFPAGQELVMDNEQLRAFNEAIAEKSPTVYDLARYPDNVPGAQVKTWVSERSSLIKDDIYVKNRSVSAFYRQLIADELAADKIAQTVAVKYAVIIIRANLRALPTNEGWFSSPGDTHFDRLQETALDPGEPVAVLHQSKSGNFFFVQAYNYRGWLPAWTMAFTAKNIWLEYVQPKEFLVVTDNKITIGSGAAAKIYQMGARIIIKNAGPQDYTVRLPAKKSDGSLYEEELTLPADKQKYHLGYLSYTRHNIIRQAFRFLNDPYGWGGLSDSVDCSSFLANIYRSVGVYLPRDADTQEQTAGVSFIFRGLPQDSRRAMFAGLLPGDALFMPGHTLLYLGGTQNTPYAIHSLARYYENGRAQWPMRVVVSDLNLKTAGGYTHFSLMTSAVSYR